MATRSGISVPADTPRADHEFTPCKRCGAYPTSHGDGSVWPFCTTYTPRPEPAEREPEHCALVCDTCHGEGDVCPCDCHKPAAGDPLGEMAREWLDANMPNSSPLQRDVLVPKLCAAFERLVRQDAAVPLSMRCSEQPCPCHDCKVLEAVAEAVEARYGLTREGR